MTYEQFITTHADLLAAAENRDGMWTLTTEPAKAPALLAALRPLFDYPEDLTCVDEGETLPAGAQRGRRGSPCLRTRAAR